MRTFLRTVVRRALGFAITLSALACLGFSWHWWQSYQPTTRQLTVETEGRLIECTSHEGVAYVQIIRDWPGTGRLGFGHSPDTNSMRGRREAWGVRMFEADVMFYQMYSPTLQDLGAVGGSWMTKPTLRPDNPRPVARVVSVPLRYPVLLTALAPALWFVAVMVRAPRRLRTAARRRRGECLRCGYDLRFSRGRCPECGEPIPPRAGAA